MEPHRFLDVTTTLLTLPFVVPTRYPLLRCDRENREHLKYLRNVYCVMTNHSKDQDMQTSHKITN